MQGRQRLSLNQRTFQSIKSIFCAWESFQESCSAHAWASTHFQHQCCLSSLQTTLAFQHVLCTPVLCPSSVQDGALTLTPDKHIALQLCLL